MSANPNDVSEGGHRTVGKVKYLSCQEARALPGLRLVLSMGGPGPWSESAKYLMRQRAVPFVAVGQEVLGDNDELFAWTGMRNAPIAIYGDERPRHTWIDLLYLAERLGTGASLLPESRAAQIECIGISHQIIGEDGLGWNRRLNIFKMLADAAGGDILACGLPARAFVDYDGRPDAMNRATARLIDILGMLHSRLEQQRTSGSQYLVGNALTAADLYFAAFLGMVEPLPSQFNPMPDNLRYLYTSGEPQLRRAVTSELIAHRDFIYGTHIGLPLDY